MALATARPAYSGYRRVSAMNNNEIAKLKPIVARIQHLNGEMKAARFEIKELADLSWDACGVSAKAVKQMAKEASWDAIARERQKQLEEEVDQCRNALGMLSDLPLGEAALKNNGKDAGEPQHHANNPKYKSGAKGKKGKKAELAAAH